MQKTTVDSGRWADRDLGPKTSLENWEAAYPSRALINQTAVEHNIRTLASRIGNRSIMAILKAEAYGHGRQIVAQAAQKAQVNYFGLAQLGEALQMRSEFDQLGYPRPNAQRNPGSNKADFKVGPSIFTWIYPPQIEWEIPLQADLEISVSYPQALDQIILAAEKLKKPALVHLKIETGMGRAGATLEQWDDLLIRAQKAQKQGLIKVVGIWSHLAQADDPSEVGTAMVNAQVEKFEAAVRQARIAGFTQAKKHLAATSGVLWHPQTHYDLVRFGIGMYGLSPNPNWQNSSELQLIPAMRLQAQLVLIKEVSAGQRVSYGGTWVAPRDTVLGIVPLGYADGIPRQASNKLAVTVGGCQYPQVGRICMDQMVVDLGPKTTLKIGDWVTVFGAGNNGELTADDWAEASETINYTIVTQIGPRVPRVVQKGVEDDCLGNYVVSDSR